MTQNFTTAENEVCNVIYFLFLRNARVDWHSNFLYAHSLLASSILQEQVTQLDQILLVEVNEAQ